MKAKITTDVGEWYVQPGIPFQLCYENANNKKIILSAYKNNGGTPVRLALHATLDKESLIKQFSTKSPIQPTLAHFLIGAEINLFPFQMLKFQYESLKLFLNFSAASPNLALSAENPAWSRR